MTLSDALGRLEALGNATTRKHNTKWGAGDNQFGVKHGDIRALAKTLPPDPALALSLWETGN
ncbi:DNA alkylation repair protein, partial [bacterium]|nr:DNA alkylation repair protein [bacterium]